MATTPDAGDARVEGREKYWSEIDGSEKVERLRQIVKQQQGELRRLSGLVDMLANHEHGKLGQVLSQVRQGGYQTFPSRTQGDKVYF